MHCLEGARTVLPGAASSVLGSLLYTHLEGVICGALGAHLGGRCLGIGQAIEAVLVQRFDPPLELVLRLR